MKLKLYTISTSELESIKDWPETFMGFRLVIYRPGLFSIKRYRTNALYNLMWFLVSRGTLRILLLFDGEQVIHTSYLTRKTFRYPFMSRKDINIGQITTDPAYRGRGIMTNVLKLIYSFYADKSENLWIYCDEENIGSQKAIERSGTKFVSFMKMSELRILKPL